MVCARAVCLWNGGVVWPPWRLADPGAIVEASGPAWRSWGISREDAYDHARAHFTAAFSESIHDCECGGSGCGAPAPELVWPVTGGSVKGSATG